MTSAYGGIRWGTGMSRAFQYEKTQEPHRSSSLGKVTSVYRKLADFHLGVAAPFRFERIAARNLPNMTMRFLSMGMSNNY